MAYTFSKTSLEKLEGIDPSLKEVILESIEKSPIDFGISSGLRTAEEQHVLFNKSLSKCDGYNKKSKHQSGKAIDVYAYVNKKGSWNKTHLAIIAGVILSTAQEFNVPIRWGGTFGSKNFNGWDYPHFELM